MPKSLTIYNKIIELRKRYYSAREGMEALLAIVSAAEVAEHVYNSNAIENSTLTLEETEKILRELELDRFITQRELFEAKNLARVMEYIDVRAAEVPLTLEVVLFLHRMLITNIQDDIAGRFRQDNEWVRVASHIAPPPSAVIPLLSQMLNEYHANVELHIVKRIARLHLIFEFIHPFIDGNGRLGRALNNYLLIREGYVPINIKYINRTRYYEALSEFDQNRKTDRMEEIVGKALTNSYFKRLAYLEGKAIMSLSQYAKNKKLSLSNLLNKAERQTIEAFTERGVWKIGLE